MWQEKEEEEIVKDIFDCPTNVQTATGINNIWLVINAVKMLKLFKKGKGNLSKFYRWSPRAIISNYGISAVLRHSK